MAGELAEATSEDLAQRLAYLEEVLGEDVRNRLEERERAARTAAERRRFETELRVQEEERRRAEIAEAAAEKVRCERRRELMVEAKALFERTNDIYDELVTMASQSSSAKYIALNTRVDDADRPTALWHLVREGLLPWSPKPMMYLDDEGADRG